MPHTTTGIPKRVDDFFRLGRGSPLNAVLIHKNQRKSPKTDKYQNNCEKRVCGDCSRLIIQA